MTGSVTRGSGRGGYVQTTWKVQRDSSWHSVRLSIHATSRVAFAGTLFLCVALTCSDSDSASETPF